MECWAEMLDLAWLKKGWEPASYVPAVEFFQLAEGVL